MADLSSGSTEPTGAYNTYFRFRDLPDEQRNSIYCFLFDDITRESHEFDVWKLDEGLPRYKSLQTYLALLTCRQLRQEASSIFEQEYLPRITFHSDAMRELVRLGHSSRLTKSRAKVVYVACNLFRCSARHLFSNPQLFRHGRQRRELVFGGPQRRNILLVHDISAKTRKYWVGGRALGRQLSRGKTTYGFWELAATFYMRISERVSD